MRLPWYDPRGRFSPLKAVVLLLLCAPGAAIGWDFVAGAFPARPFEAINKAAGGWTIRLVLLSLAITPLQRILRLPRLALVRRMIGVAAACYATAHFLAFAADKMFDLRLIAMEIVLRIYLAIGMSALLILLALAITSTDGMVRTMGGARWQALHRGVYAAALLGIVHFFLQARLGLTEPSVIAGLFGWLMVWRVVLWRSGPERAAAPTTVLVLATVAGVLTATAEALYFHLRTGADFAMILSANFGIQAGMRPGPVVLAAGLALFLAAAAKNLALRPRLA